MESAGHLLPAGSVFAFLAEHRRALLPDEMFADLFPSGRGRPSVPADVVATVLVLQALHPSSARWPEEVMTRFASSSRLRARPAPPRAGGAGGTGARPARGASVEEVVVAVAMDRAVVVGGSISGLLAARALSEHAREVVVVDRDPLPSGKEQRRGVPQGRHVHALLARGREILEQQFPGFTQEVIDRGGLTGDLLGDGRIYMNGGYIVSYTSGLDVLCASRPLLEAVTRERVRSLDNVRFADSTEALGLIADDGRVTGLRTRTGRDGAERQLAAALVVSATGRAATPLRWLAELGYPAPREEEIRVDLTYVTRTFRRRAGDLAGARYFVVTPDPPHVRSAGVFAQEDGLWRVTLIGYLGERPPTDLDGFSDFAASLPTPELTELLRHAEPVGEVATAHFPASRRRLFERASSFPEGYLVFGDAISSFNPVYGQGMSVAAEESLALGRAAQQGLDDLPRRFFQAAGKVIDVPWSLAAGSDLRFPTVTGPRSPQTRFLNAYVARLLVAARHDPVVAQAFARANNLLDTPQSLLRPQIAARVLLGGSSRAARVPKQRTRHAEHRSTPSR